MSAHSHVMAGRSPTAVRLRHAPQFPARAEKVVDARAKHGHDRVRWNRRSYSFARSEPGRSSGHPRFWFTCKEDVDARDKPAHDEMGDTRDYVNALNAISVKVSLTPGSFWMVSVTKWPMSCSSDR